MVRNLPVVTNASTSLTELVTPHSELVTLFLTGNAVSSQVTHGPDGSGPGWGEVTHILHHARSGEPRTVKALPAPFSYCIESIQSSEAETASWGSAETWPRNRFFFPASWVTPNFVGGGLDGQWQCTHYHKHTHTLSEWMQKVWSETKCYKCSEREHGLEEKKEKGWHHSEC